MWNYVVTAQKPTSVTHSLVGHFTSPTDLNLIICKCNRVEIHLLTPDGLQPLLDIGIYGRIATMELFRPNDEKQDLLFISTERYKFCVLAFDSSTGEIVTRANGDVHDRIGRPSDIGPIGIIDPDRRLIGLHIYDGLFKVIPIESKVLKEAYNIRFEELQIIALKFLYHCSRPTIAVLYQDTKDARHVKTYEVLTKEKEFGEGPWNLANVEASASILIPVPTGGVLIIGEQTITYHSGSYFKSIAMKTTIIKAYGVVDPDGSRYLLGDFQGNLYMLILHQEDKKIVDMKLEILGVTSIASTISYLDNGVIFIGSCYGDSQLLRINSQKDENGSYLEQLESFINLGPIVDFCVVDLERQGQGQVVTCSGAFKDGSLRIIRNGIGINEQATIELPGIKGLWSLKPNNKTEHDKYIILSFVGETRVLEMNGEELEETEIKGFKSDEQTIYCGNVVGDCFIQITSTSIILVKCGTHEAVHKWSPSGDAKITVASCNTNQIIVGIGGGNLVYLQIVNSQIKEINHKKLEHEISCVNVNPVGDSNEAQLCAVGMWTDITVRLLTLPDLNQVVKEPLGGEIIPRSVLLAHFEGINYLFCALGDGHLFTFIIRMETKALYDKKNLSLGTQPIVLNTFTSNGQTHVFAASDRPTVIYSANKKLLYSNVNLKEVNQMCAFNSESFPDSLAIATEESLTIGTIDAIQKLHIRTVPLGEMPRRIAHQESTSTFCLLTIKQSFETSSDEIETGFIKLIDEQTFEITSSFQLGQYENGCSVISCTFADDLTSYYVVGTAFAIPTEAEPSRGRLLVFCVQDSNLKLVAEVETKGAAYSLSSFNGKLLAGINSKIQLYKWEETEEGVRQLTFECSHHGHILALFVVSRGDFIVVGDLMKSISLLLYKPLEQTIEEIARDYNPNWMTAIEALDDDTYIGAENSYNLFVVRKNAEAATDEERSRLDTVGQYHLGEFVNKFRHGSLVMKLPEMTNEEPDIPTLIYATVSGSIGVIATLNQENYNFFKKVQENLTKVIKGVGGFIHSEWRSFSNERKTSEARNVLDGDLIESYLDLKADKMNDVVKGLDITAEELSKRIETLQQALH